MAYRREVLPTLCAILSLSWTTNMKNTLTTVGISAVIGTVSLLTGLNLNKDGVLENIDKVQRQTFKETGNLVQVLEDGTIPDYSPKANIALPKGAEIHTYYTPEGGIGYRLYYDSGVIGTVATTTS